MSILALEELVEKVATVPKEVQVAVLEQEVQEDRLA